MNILNLACNPNLSKDEFESLSKKIMQDKIKLIETATNCMNKLPTQEMKISYATQVLSIMVMF